MGAVYQRELKGYLHGMTGIIFVCVNLLFFRADAVFGKSEISGSKNGIYDLLSVDDPVFDGADSDDALRCGGKTAKDRSVVVFLTDLHAQDCVG